MSRPMKLTLVWLLGFVGAIILPPMTAYVFTLTTLLPPILFVSSLVGLIITVICVVISNKILE